MKKGITAESPGLFPVFRSEDENARLVVLLHTAGTIRPELLLLIARRIVVIEEYSDLEGIRDRGGGYLDEGGQDDKNGRRTEGVGVDVGMDIDPLGGGDDLVGHRVEGPLDVRRLHLGRRHLNPSSSAPGHPRLPVSRTRPKLSAGRGSRRPSPAGSRSELYPPKTTG